MHLKRRKLYFGNYKNKEKYKFKAFIAQTDEMKSHVCFVFFFFKKENFISPHFKV